MSHLHLAILTQENVPSQYVRLLRFVYSEISFDLPAERIGPLGMLLRLWSLISPNPRTRRQNFPDTLSQIYPLPFTLFKDTHCCASYMSTFWLCHPITSPSELIANDQTEKYLHRKWIFIPGSSKELSLLPNLLSTCTSDLSMSPLVFYSNGSRMLSSARSDLWLQFSLTLLKTRPSFMIFSSLLANVLISQDTQKKCLFFLGLLTRLTTFSLTQNKFRRVHFVKSLITTIEESLDGRIIHSGCLLSMVDLSCLWRNYLPKQ